MAWNASHNKLSFIHLYLLPGQVVCLNLINIQGGKLLIIAFNNKLFTNLNPSWPGLPELHKSMGGGKICPTIIFFSNWVENPFFYKVCHSLNCIKTIKVKVGCVKEKWSKKKLQRKNPRGGGIELVKLPILDFIFGVKCTIFWLNIGLVNIFICMKYPGT